MNLLINYIGLNEYITASTSVSYCDEMWDLDNKFDRTLIMEIACENLAGIRTVVKGWAGDHHNLYHLLVVF